MTVAMWAPILVAVLLAASGRSLARRLHPAVAVSLLTFAAFTTALATNFVLAVAAFDAMALLAPVAELGHWSVAAVRPGGTPSVGLGVVAGFAVTVLLAAAAHRAARIGVDLRHAVETCRRLGPDADGLVVLHDDEPDAFALPAIRGRVVVSTGMLRMLPPEERRVLLAHERAHLGRGHHVYVQAAALAAAANPLLRPLAREVERGVERWADEVAAAEVGDRRLAARALARASLARAASRADGRPGLALPGAGPAGVGARALALLQPPPRRRRWPAVALIAVTLVAAGGAVWTASTTEDRFEHAQATYAVAP
jgi:Zn-dependent protease with chaperone function